jgi:hypothetical protein
MVEQSDSSRDSNFEETHDTLFLKNFVAAQAHNGLQASTLLQTPMSLSQVQSPYPGAHSRDVFEIFGNFKLILTK